MRALIMTILVSFQLTACVTGDNDEPTTDEVATTDVTVIEEDEGIEIAETLAALENMLEVFELQPNLQHTHPVPRHTQLE